MNTPKYLYHKIIFIIGFFAIISCSSDDTPIEKPTTVVDPSFTRSIEWIKTFGGSKDDEALSVVQSNDGGYVVLGYTQSIDGDITDKTATDSDFWVLKLTEQGTISWSKTFGGSGDDRGAKIIKTSDGGYALVGYSRSNDEDVSTNEGLQDYWILKITTDGEIQWEKSFGFPGIDRAFSVIETSDQGYFVTGFLDVSASNGEGNDTKNNTQKHGVGEFWGIKLNNQGEKVWRRYFGGSDNDRSYDVVETPDNGYLMIGSSESNDFDITNNKGSYDFWVIKINSVGTKIWEKSYGGSEIDVAYAITTSGNGKYTIIGDTRSNDGDITTTKGNADLWMIQIDDNGNLLWEKTLGGSQFDTGRGIYTMQDGTILITGNSRSNDYDINSNKGQSDIWNIIIDNNGDPIWSSTNGGSAEEFATGCIQTVNDNIIIVGSTKSNDLDIDNNKGLKDAIILKYK